MSQFFKPAISPKEQIQLLLDRGLNIGDQDKALSFISSVSFFRLSPYMRPFQKDNDQHTFHVKVEFKQLAELYDFDRRLRLLVMDAIERAEIAVRASISNYMGVVYGAHWYLDSTKYTRQYKHKELLESIENKQKRAKKDYLRECSHIDKLNKSSVDKVILKTRRKQESYARHYEISYSEPPLMPNWAMLEELTLGQLSHMFKGLRHDRDKKAIARQLNLPAPLLESWLHTLTAIRNICAHHSRLWNRELGIKPSLPRNRLFRWPQYLVQANEHQGVHTRIATVLPILQHIMMHCAPDNSWKQRLLELFKTLPSTLLRSTGLPERWHEDPFWQ